MTYTPAEVFTIPSHFSIKGFKKLAYHVRTLGRKKKQSKCQENGQNQDVISPIDSRENNLLNLTTTGGQKSFEAWGFQRFQLK